MTEIEARFAAEDREAINRLTRMLLETQLRLGDATARVEELAAALRGKSRATASEWYDPDNFVG